MQLSIFFAQVSTIECRNSSKILLQERLLDLTIFKFILTAIRGVILVRTSRYPFIFQTHSIVQVSWFTVKCIWKHFSRFILKLNEETYKICS